MKFFAKAFFTKERLESKGRGMKFLTIKMLICKLGTRGRIIPGAKMEEE